MSTSTRGSWPACSSRWKLKQLQHLSTTGRQQPCQACLPPVPFIIHHHLTQVSHPIPDDGAESLGSPSGSVFFRPFGSFAYHGGGLVLMFSSRLFFLPFFHSAFSDRFPEGCSTTLIYSRLYHRSRGGSGNPRGHQGSVSFRYVLRGARACMYPSFCASGKDGWRRKGGKPMHRRFKLLR